MPYIAHPNIPKDINEERAYQVAIATSTRKANPVINSAMLVADSANVE